MLALDQSAVAVWPENFGCRRRSTRNADLAAGELITSGFGLRRP